MEYITTDFYDDIALKPAQDKQAYTGVDSIEKRDNAFTGDVFMGSFGSQTEIAAKDEEEIINDFEYLYLPHLKGKKKPIRSNFAISVVRTHFNEKLINDLDWLAQNHEEDSHTSFPYVSSLLCNLKEYSDSYSDDIYCSFLLALYDSLIHENSYLSISSAAYSKVLKMIEFLNNKTLDYGIVDKYIFKLEEAGFNVTPY
jgi:hypothetical protein